MNKADYFQRFVKYINLTKNAYDSTLEDKNEVSKCFL